MGCRRRRPQDELVRIARTRDGTLAVGRTLRGRGAWLCAGSVPCFDHAVRSRALARALRASRTHIDIERLHIDFVKSVPAARD